MARRIDPNELVVHFKQQAAAVIGIAGAHRRLRRLPHPGPCSARPPAGGQPDQGGQDAGPEAGRGHRARRLVDPALRVFLASYIVFAVTTWFVYVRRSSPLGDAAV